MQNSKYHSSPISQNAKTGPMFVSTSDRRTCPDSCPLKANGCYVVGPVGWHWDKVTAGKRGDTFAGFLEKVRRLPGKTFWRHNQAGDLPGENEIIDGAMLADLVKANTGRNGFTYTHKPVLDRQNGPVKENREAIAAANRDGFTVNLSANGLNHADELAALGIGPVATILPDGITENTTTPSGRKVVICPAQKIEGMNCARCRLCARGQRSVVVGFMPHGAAKKKAAVIAAVN
jgi:hypothetical protein